MRNPDLLGGARLGMRGNLAPGTHLRLEVTLLAACLRGQRPESESLSGLCLRSMGMKALLVAMRFLRTQIRNCRIWSDWKYNGLLPLVVTALSRSYKVLQWFLSQFLRYSFCGICGNELEVLVLIVWGQKITFSSLANPSQTILLSHLLVWWHSEGTSWLLFIPLWLTISTCGQDCTQGCA